MADTNVRIKVDVAQAGQAFKAVNESMGRARGAADQLGKAFEALSGGAGALGRALGGLGSALASGSVIGAASALFGALVGYLQELNKAADEAKKKWETTLDKVVSKGDEAARKIRRRQLEASGMAPELAAALTSGDMADVNQAEVDAGIKLNEAKAKLDKSLDFNAGQGRRMLAEGKSLADIAKFYSNVRDAVEEVTKAEKELAEVQKSRKLILQDAKEEQRERERKDAVQKTTKATQDAATAEKLVMQSRVDLAKSKVSTEKDLEKQRDAEIEAIRAEHSAKLADINKSQILNEKQKQEMRRNLDEETNNKIVAARAKFEKMFQDLKTSELDKGVKQDKEDAMNEASTMTGWEEEGARMPDYEKLKASDFAKEQSAFNRQLQESINLGQQFGATFANAFSGMAAGTASVGQAFAQMGAQILGIILDIAIKSITADAVKAGAGAASSQAGVPIVGPALAVAAMTAMIGTVMGLLSSLPGRAKGGPVSLNTPYIVGEMGPELFIPGASGGIVPNNALAAMTGGGTTNNYIINAMDGKSVERVLRRNARAVTKTIRREQKGRRF